MTDFSTTVAAGGTSNGFVYDNAKNLFYFAVGGDVFSYDPLTGTKATLLTVEGTIGDLAMASAGDQLIVGMQDLVPNDDPALRLGTIYRVPMATAGDAATYQTVHFSAGFRTLGVYQMAVVTGDELLITGLETTLPTRIPAGFTGTATYDWNEQMYGMHLIVSENGRYTIGEENFTTAGEYAFYDNQTDTLIKFGGNSTFNTGVGDISEAAGLVYLPNFVHPQSVFDFNMDLVADLSDPIYGGHIQGDAKFNTGGHQLFLWDIASGQIEVVDTTSWTTIGTLSANLSYFGFFAPDQVGVSADGHFLYRKTGENFEFIDLFSRLETTQTGTTGDDVLYSTQGQDTLDGDGGFDKISYVDATAGVTVTLASPGVGQNTLGAGTDTLTNIEGLIGSSHDDSLSGNSAGNVLDGGAGADTLKGGAGDDTYIVDNSGDVVVELLNKGADLVQSSASFTIGLNIENLTLTGVSDIDGTGNGLANTIVGNSGNNRLDGKGGADSLTGGTGNDTYIIDNVGDVVTELADQGIETVEATVDYALGANVENLRLQGAGNRNGVGNELDNVLIGNSGANALKGLIGKDFLDGGTGADRMYGGADDDTYVVDNVGDIVVENTGEGTDVVQASVSFTLGQNVENLTLSGSDNVVGNGNSLANNLTGNEGNNRLDGRGGADTMAGGTGNDTYAVDTLSDVVTELDGQGTDTVEATIDYTLGANLEGLTFLGVGNRNGSGNELNNVLTGNSGANVLRGLAGNDFIDGMAGSDRMYGGIGDDTYVVESSGDRVFENPGEGTDSVQAALDYTLGTDLENLTLTGVGNLNGNGNSLANMLTGNGGNNRLDGKGGADSLSGGLGNDTYVVYSAMDVVTELGGQGIDVVETSVGGLSLGANIENLTMIGSGNLTATGNGDANLLTGNIGNNVLNGLAGADTMMGGLGNDSYFVDNAGDVVSELAGEGTDLVFAKVSYMLGADVENLSLQGAGNFAATGNNGANILTGNAGSNTLAGLGGADTFVFKIGSGADIVSDFSAADNDMIDIHAYTAGITNTALLTTVGANTLIDLGGGNTITIVGLVSTDAGLLSHIVW